MKMLGIAGGCWCLFASGLAVAADPSVQNRCLRVRFEEPSRRLLLCTRSTDTSFATSDSFAPEGVPVQAVKVNDRVFGKGEALEALFPDGHRDQALVFPDSPFVFFRRTLKNGNAQTITNRISYPAINVELGLRPPR